MPEPTDEGPVCAECGQPIEDAGVWEVTLDSQHFQLRGLFFGDLAHLRAWAAAQEQFGPVTASPLEHHHEATTDSAPVCPSCGAVAELVDGTWETGHAIDCAWMQDPESESYG